MRLQHDALPRSVGRLRSVVEGEEPVQGTGFLIAPNRLLTCAHCVRGQSGTASSGTIEFTQVSSSRPVPFEVLYERFQPEAGIDVAVLGLKRPVPDTACLKLATSVEQGQRWKTFGHPEAIKGTPLWLGGTVDGTIGRNADGHDGYLLSLSVDGDASKPIAGMSGAPVVVDGGVVGIVSNQLYAKAGAADAPEPAFSKAFAVPSSALQRFEALTATLKRPAKVFIAYRREPMSDRMMKALNAELSRRGHEPFADIAILGGEDWARRLQQTLADADVFVPIITEASLESAMLLQEIRLAYRRWRQSGRPIIVPVLNASVQSLPFEFDTYLGALQYAHWEAKDEEAPLQLIGDAVDLHMLEVPAPPDDRPSFPPAATFNRLRSTASALSPDDPFYIERPSDAHALQRLDAERVVVTIIAPSGFGKTSLAVRLRRGCEQAGRRVVLIDFRWFGRLPDDGSKGFVTFINDFADVLFSELGIEPPHAPFRFPGQIMARVRDALEGTAGTIVIFDGVDILITRKYAEDFFSACRHWADDVELPLSFVFCIAVKPSVLINDVNRSPFNIDASPIELEPFRRDAIAWVAAKAGVELRTSDVDLIYEVTGGHPAMVRQALAYVLRPGEAGEDDVPTRSEVETRVSYVFERCGSVTDGPFSSHLKALLSRLGNSSWRGEGETDLLEVLSKIALGKRLTADESEWAARLEAMGVVRPGASEPGTMMEKAIRFMEVFGLRRAASSQRFVPLNLAYARFFGSSRQD